MLLFPLLASCIDNTLTGSDKDPVVFDSGSTIDPPTSEDTATTPPGKETCNGEDDDDDGLVDEDFPDDDGNGRADCEDQECPAAEPGDAGSVEIVEECQGTTSSTSGEEVDDPWNAVEKWNYNGGATWMTPVIGNLDDDNGDGTIDEEDIPEVVVSLSSNTVVALDGASGSVKWTASGTNGYGDTLIADVDADGSPDVIAADTQGRTIALDGVDGSNKWTADDRLTSLNYMMHTVADLDEDGEPEVIHDNTVLSGMDGSTLFDLDATSGGGQVYRIAAVGDVDNDGDQEIALEGALFDSDGDLLWDSGEVGTYGMWPILINADSDDEAEVGFVGENWSLFEADGTEIYSTTYNRTSQPGPPCAGDFDGDGTAEVGWPAYQNFVMYELDGTQIWSVNMDDTSGLAGCSGYDLNNDGALEVLFADQSSFTIFDGSTGTELFTASHYSPTIFEYPTVADIDNDGHAEIVVAHYGTPSTVTAYEHGGDGWPAAGTTWNVHDFAITNINPDGSVPQHPEASWTKYNVYRARVAADDPSTPDLVAWVTDVCVMDCDYGPLQVSVQVANQGGSDVEAGAYVALYTLDDEPRLVASQALGAITAGEKLEGITFELDPGDVGERGWTVSVDYDDTVGECDETNNTDDWVEVYCP